MIRVLAIDDEPLALQQLAAYIKKIPFLELVAECQSAIEAKEILNNENIDAIFCDINMPDLNGMDFVKSLSTPPLIVFTTALGKDNLTFTGAGPLFSIYLKNAEVTIFDSREH